MGVKSVYPRAVFFHAKAQIEIDKTITLYCLLNFAGNQIVVPLDLVFHNDQKRHLNERYPL